MTSEYAIAVFVNGACSGNPGPGGWGCYFELHGENYLYSGFLKLTTNQRAELSAVIESLSLLKGIDNPLCVYSESSYLVNCFLLDWRSKCFQNDWRNSKGDHVANQDLWKQLFELVTSFSYVEFRHVKYGAGGIVIADRLAKEAIKEGLKGDKA